MENRISTIVFAVPLAIAAAFFAVFPVTPAEASAGVCTDLGCVGGDTKCADGSMEYPDGPVVKFTCYTELRAN